MSTTTNMYGGVQVLRLEGDLAGPNVTSFRRAAEELLERDERDYVVDLSLAQACDSAGLEALTWLKRLSEERLGEVKLCNLNPTVETILRMTRLDRKLDCHPNLDAALASFG